LTVFCTDLAAAFAGIAVSNNDTLLALLETVGRNTGSSIESRSLALERMATARPEKAAPLIVDLVAALPEGASAVNMARAMLNEKQGSKLLTAALAGRELRTDVARDILRVLRESGRTDSDLENALRTAGKITSRKSLTVEERAAMLTKATTSASAAEGERIYRNEQLGCLKCHAIGGAGGLVDNLTDDEIASVVRFLSELGRTPEYTLSKSRLVRSWQVVMPMDGHGLNTGASARAMPTAPTPIQNTLRIV